MLFKEPTLLIKAAYIKLPAFLHILEQLKKESIEIKKGIQVT
jgi:hypothetical protein